MKVAHIKTRIYLGAFLIGLVALASLCILLAGDSFNFFKSTQTYRASFATTAGLVAGAPVRMGGVEIGRVVGIQIEAKGDHIVNIAKLRIDSPYYELIRSDASVSMDTQGLLGDKYITLFAGSSTDPLAPDELIATRENNGLSQAMEKSNQILDRVNSVSAKLDTFADSLPESTAMNAMGRDFAASAQSLRQLLKKLSSDDSLIAELNEPAAKASLIKTLGSMESAAAHADSIAQKIDLGQGTLGALINDKSLYEDLREMLGHRERSKIVRRTLIEAAAPRDK